MSKRFLALMAAAFLALMTVRPAGAKPSAEEVEAAYNRLHHYGIVISAHGPIIHVVPFMNQPITRAQVVAILVRVWGREGEAKLLTGAPTGYADVDGVDGLQWTTGYLFVANRITQESGGQSLGTSPTTFHPSGEATPMTILAFTMKFLGLPVATGDDWVARTSETAKEAGLLTEESATKYLEKPSAPVDRGEAFAFLDYLFSEPVPGEDGKPLYQK